MVHNIVWIEWQWLSGFWLEVLFQPYLEMPSNGTQDLLCAQQVAPKLWSLPSFEDFAEYAIYPDVTFELILYNFMIGQSPCDKDGDRMLASADKSYSLFTLELL